jgi:hypothetical protein
MPCSFGLSGTSQQYFSFRTNQSSATSQQYLSLRTNQHHPSATSQTNMLLVFSKLQQRATLEVARIVSELKDETAGG